MPQADVLTAVQIEEARDHTVAITGLCSVQGNKAALEVMQVGWVGGWAAACAAPPLLRASLLGTRQCTCAYACTLRMALRATVRSHVPP